ncbi:phospholipase A1-like [Anthonomus grandis grandis]|uniref:phospholipase A1-like n=1 Tax=Anthonomus grandis grandis TaxID=2921223 RepID=UPI00216510D2|nr:phospholipase A1-like [Anthonomus grandis grandis]
MWFWNKILSFLGLFYYWQLCHADSALKLPSQEDFIAEVLNITVDKLQEIARNFKFTVDESIGSNIKLIQFKGDTNISTSLNEKGDIEIDASEQIVIIIHGYQSAGTADWVKSMAALYQENGVRNVLAVDWSEYAGKGYLLAAGITREVGRLIAKWFYKNVLQENPSGTRNMQLVGHSLGGHVSGFMAKKLFGLVKKKIQRISGLDVAAPLFEFPIKRPDENRLSKSDAKQVDVYHSNKGFFGFLTRFGQQDFYINKGGPIQPGCNMGINVISSLQCSHSYSHLFFTQTINSTNHVATLCDNTVLLDLGKCDDNFKVISGQNTNSSSVAGIFYGSADENGLTASN